MVDDVDAAFAGPIHSAPTRPDTSHDQEPDEQKLQVQKQILAQLLPDTIDVQVLDRAFPKHRARYDRLLSLELQKIQTQDRRRDRK